MKSKKFSLLLVCISIALSFVGASKILAAEPFVNELPGTDQAVLIADVVLRNARIEAQNGTNMNVVFDVVNNGETQNDVQVKIELVLKQGDKMYTLDQYASPVAFQSEKGSRTTQTVAYQAPSYLKGDYEIILSIGNISGLIYALADVGKISLQGDGNYITIGTAKCYLTVDGEASQPHYTLSQGVDLGTGEVLRAHCPIKNESAQPIIGLLSFETYWRSAFGETLETPSHQKESFSLAAKESKEVSFIIPTVTTPQAYDAVASFSDASGNRISNETVFHYVIRGLSGTIQTAQYRVSPEDNALIVSFEWTPSADTHNKTRQEGTIAPYYAEVTVKNGAGEDCFQETKKQLDILSSSQDISIPLTGPCVNPQVSLNIVSGSGDILDGRTVKDSSLEKSIEDLAQITADKNEATRRTIVYTSLTIITLLIVGVGIFYWKRRGVVSLFVLIIAGTLLSGSYASAASWVNSDCDSPGHCVNATASAQLDRDTYTVGETITASWTLYDSRCSNGSGIPSLVTFTAFAIEQGTGTQINPYDDGTSGAIISDRGFFSIAATRSGNYQARICTQIQWNTYHKSCVYVPFSVMPSVSVSKSGAGAGTVVATGISCGTTCSGSYPYNTSLALSAIPDVGSKFSAWGGDCSGGATTCNLIVDSNKSVTAIFDRCVIVPSSAVCHPVNPAACQRKDCGKTFNGSQYCTALDNCGNTKTVSCSDYGVASCAPASVICPCGMDWKEVSPLK
jgi:hypothetical protein